MMLGTKGSKVTRKQRSGFRVTALTTLHREGKAMKRYKGIIFDLDGTLLDTIEDLGTSMNEVLTYYNLPEHPIEEYKMLVGNGMKNLLLSSISPDQLRRIDTDQAFQMFREVYGKRYMNATGPYEGIAELLSWFTARDVKLAVNSNKRDDYTEALVMKFFASIPFVRVYGEQTRFPRKPDPAAALEIASAMGEAPEDILYIGDSEVDMATGKNAGMDTVGVLWGFRSRSELEASEAVYIVSEPKNIRRLFDEV